MATLPPAAHPPTAAGRNGQFGFVDDLELHAESGRGVLEARSVSRLGDSDLGVNAQRLAILRQALDTSSPSL